MAPCVSIVAFRIREAFFELKARYAIPDCSSEALSALLRHTASHRGTGPGLKRDFAPLFGGGIHLPGFFPFRTQVRTFPAQARARPQFPVPWGYDGLVFPGVSPFLSITSTQKKQKRSSVVERIGRTPPGSGISEMVLHAVVDRRSTILPGRIRLGINIRQRPSRQDFRLFSPDARSRLDHGIVLSSKNQRRGGDLRGHIDIPPPSWSISLVQCHALTAWPPIQEPSLPRKHFFQPFHLKDP